VPTDVTAFLSAQFTPYAGSWALSSANRFGLNCVPSNKPDEKKENNNTNSNKDINKDNSTISGPSVNGQKGLDILAYLYNLANHVTQKNSHTVLRGMKAAQASNTGSGGGGGGGGGYSNNYYIPFFQSTLLLLEVWKLLCSYTLKCWSCDAC
jgi:hypothetical protein